MFDVQVKTESSVNRASTQVVGVVIGALAVAVGSHLSVPIPGTPVPMTFQVPMIILVGALLGPKLGALSMGLYLTMGAAGLPVFSPFGAPGFARLIGPTGGYLLAYPVAAALMGSIAGKDFSWAKLSLGGLAAMAAIHLGGIAQLTILTGEAGTAVLLGSLPFLAGDLLKTAFVVLVLRKLHGMRGAQL
ncbi:MAG: biotin transporter BioY [Gemmatimonadota bacterium]|nr:biotin transporter BioY [Gemmatimonadota bacterium]